MPMFPALTAGCKLWVLRGGMVRAVSLPGQLA